MSDCWWCIHIAVHLTASAGEVESGVAVFFNIDFQLDEGAIVHTVFRVQSRAEPTSGLLQESSNRNSSIFLYSAHVQLYNFLRVLLHECLDQAGALVVRGNLRLEIREVVIQTTTAGAAWSLSWVK